MSPSEEVTVFTSVYQTHTLKISHSDLLIKTFSIAKNPFLNSRSTLMKNQCQYLI